MVSLHIICSVVKMLLVYEPPSDKQLATVVDISAEDDHSNTALHHAARRGHCSVADTLINKGANIRARLAALCALCSNIPTNIIHMQTYLIHSLL